MADKPATVEALGDLHYRVARVMVNVLETYEKGQEVYLKKADQIMVADEEDLIPLDIPEPPVISPAMLGAITKFLSDNSITAAPGENKDLDELAQTLAGRQGGRRRAVGNVVHLAE